MNAFCDTILVNATSMWACKETDNGARVRTTCVYPSFEPVFVYVVKFGDGFVVHDAGETMGVILAHGQDFEVAKRVIRAECKRYDLITEDRRISLKIDSLDWLETAIVVVANTASAAARHAISESNKKSEQELADVLFELLEPQLSKGTIVQQFAFQGSSGRKYKFDLAIQSKQQLTLIQTVSAHANSVNSKFVALADVPKNEPIKKIVAHSGDLSLEDIVLLQSVAVVATKAGVLSLLGADGPKH